ncbi:hypothetical protein CF121_14420 [Aeromonas media]|uniref:HRDC domain-containing protein n=1 Tax=Aeromonas media TaxID=651 RepID=UPI001DD9370D|nr:hypothetical protein CF121_14420 [Aeromonas media]
MPPLGSTLVEMGSAAMPMTEDEMLAINGVGHRKLERFGEAFMDLIIEYCRRQGRLAQRNRPHRG